MAKFGRICIRNEIRMMLTFSLFVMFMIMHLSSCNSSQTLSYTSQGRWSNGTKWHCDHFLCTPSGLIWEPNSTDHFTYYNSTTGCDALVKKGIKVIHFHGDSYMRQIYSAMLITLSGDFAYGSIRDKNYSPQCHYQRQFFEKKCGLKELNHNGTTCGGKIWLDPLLNGFDNLNDCHPGYVKLWSFGNHKIGRGRYGVNDAKAYTEMFGNSVCPKVIQAEKERKIDAHHDKACSVWWVSTHYRLVGWFEDEAEHLVKGYNENMRDYFDSHHCGPVNYIDVYNMTLGLKNRTEAVDMSYDRVHWGMEVNLVKAQIILNAILNP